MKKSIYIKFYIALFFLGLIVLSITGVLVWRQLYNAKIDDFKEKAEQVLAGISFSIDASKIEKYRLSMKIDDEYREIVRSLDKIKDEVGAKGLFIEAPFDHDNAIYVYATTEYGDGIEDSVMGRHLLGEKIRMGEWSTQMFSGDENYKKSDVYGKSSKHGYVCTAVKTIKNSESKVIAFVGIDYDMYDEIKIVNREVIKFFINLILSFFMNLTLTVLVAQWVVINPIRKITNSVKNLMNEGQNKIIAKKIYVKNKGDDIEILVNSFNRMIVDLNTYTENIKKINAEKEQISTELNIATQIQTSLIPHTFPAFPELKEIDIYASSKPARRVGGDFYDFFLVDDNHIAFVIADVAGKGISAALFMVIARTLIRNETSLDKTPGEILKNVNAEMCVENDLGMFLTLFFGILNYKTGRIKFSNAGHLKPILKSKNDKFKELEVKKNFVIAGMPNLEFKNEELKLRKGDILFMYTDGITECSNKQSQNWGIHNLINTLNRINTEECSLKNIIEVIQQETSHFSDNKQSDDETMLIIKYNGS